MLRIEPKTLGGMTSAPSSKSIGHRVMICAALSDGVSLVRQINMSKDLEATIEALQSIGASFEPINASESDWVVGGIRRGAKATGENGQSENLPVEIHCNESGSTLRFMIPVGLSIKNNLVFTGAGRLIERPINEYFPILKASGIDYEYDGILPFKAKGSLKAGDYTLSGRVSSQYTSGMLMAAPLLEGNTELQIEGEMESKGYIDLTIDTMKQFGVIVKREGYKNFSIEKGKGYKASDVAVEADYSQAAFWIVAGLIGEKPIAIQGLNEDSYQGDRVIVEIARRMNGKLSFENGNLVVYPSKTTGTLIDASQCPDLIPVLCVLAAYSHGQTRVINGQRLRVKESDRIRSTVTELKKLGADIVETEDGMIVNGSQPSKTQVLKAVEKDNADDRIMLSGNCVAESWDDHRIVMAIAVAAIGCKEAVEINGAHAVCKSYPSFFEDYIKLGGQINGQYIW